MKREPLPASQLGQVLRVLREEKREMTPHEIAAKLGLTPHSTAVALTKLTQRGYAEYTIRRRTVNIPGKYAAADVNRERQLLDAHLLGQISTKELADALA